MILYDYRCPTCDVEFERPAEISERDNQNCYECGSKLEKLWKPTPRYVPWQPYFDIGLGEMVTGRDHHRRLMRDNNCVQRDLPSKGKLSARKDWAMEQRKAQGRRT